MQMSDERQERAIGMVLRAGVLLAALVVLAGGILYLVNDGARRTDYHSFQGEPPDLTNVPGVLHQAASHNSRGIMQLGLLLLVLTPIARVAFSVVSFAARGDRMYVIITLIVLVVLVGSLVFVR